MNLSLISLESIDLPQSLSPELKKRMPFLSKIKNLSSDMSRTKESGELCPRTSKRVTFEKFPEFQKSRFISAETDNKDLLSDETEFLSLDFSALSRETTPVTLQGGLAPKPETRCPVYNFPDFEDTQKSAV